MNERLNLDTQVKVSTAAGISQSTVGRFLKGTVSPTLDNIESLSEVFDIPAWSLISNPDENLNAHTIDYRMRNLSPADRRKITEYAELIIGSSKPQPFMANFTTQTQLGTAESTAVKRAAGRPVTTKNKEVENGVGNKVAKRKSA